ncbi:dephospho-CoA kinase [Alishewanella sp. HL-SH05]|uniref:dephospho-CoA kinase n=1 Tax=Alishewanella sp. HL-SH05 TaxID=3461145 RepID=UPI004043682F
MKQPTAITSLLIGLTGGIGSGKSTVAEHFKALGAHYVDADIVAREVVMPGSPCLAAIVQHFGPGILLADGQLDRSALRQTIFADSAAKRWLEHLLHPAIRSELLSQLAASTTPYTLLVAPLLLENGLDKLVSRVLVVDVSEQTQLARTTTRDNNSENQVRAIMAAQIDRAARLAAADDVIDNNGTAAELLPQISRLHQAYLAMSQKIGEKSQ